MDAMTTQTAFSSSFAAEIRARLSRMASPTRRRMEAAKRRAATADRISKILAARDARAQQARRVDAAYTIASTIRAVREERRSRAISAVLMCGIALCAIAQATIAVSSI
jgi:hypothetical protein